MPTAILALFAAATLVFAQAPVDTLVSPEVAPNGVATFRLRAPKAAEVTLWGDWMPAGQPQPMTKGPDGIWSLTTGPLEASGHLYWFNLDGQPIADPVNPVIKLRQRTSASIVEIPASAPSPWDLTDVPHGTVLTLWQKSPLLARTERIFIYLPPGYDKSTTRYPVLYLLHGQGDLPDSWTNAGRANLILDNLIAAGKTKPMILVMPAGHAVPFVNGTGGTPANNDLFAQYLTQEIIPLIEGRFRTAPGSRNRALAGFSMGGELTLYTGFRYPAMFSALGIFSAGLRTEHAAQFQALLVNVDRLKANRTTLWIAAGDTDTALPRAKAFAELLAKNSIPAELKIYPGPHNWARWRLSLTGFAPLLFNAK